MKNVILKSAILFTFICSLTLNGCTQTQTSNKKAKMIFDDVKFWFSEEQLLASANFAMATNQTLRRCFINGVEYTEAGYIKTSKYKDSRCVARMSTSDPAFQLIYIEVDPSKLQLPTFTYFAKYVY